jgi:hypothetical protein
MTQECRRIYVLVGLEDNEPPQDIYWAGTKQELLRLLKIEAEKDRPQESPHNQEYSKEQVLLLAEALESLADESIGVHELAGPTEDWTFWPPFALLILDDPPSWPEMSPALLFHP